MYEIGDLIVYGSNNVCEIIDVGTLDISGIDKGKQYYTLDPVYTKGRTVYTPVDNKKVPMRRILTKEEAVELIESIPSIDTLWVENEKQREEIYKESMKKNECCEWIKVIKTLYLRKKERMAQGKNVTGTDGKYLTIAEENLYGELAIALGIPKDEVEDYIAKRVDALDAV